MRRLLRAEVCSAEVWLVLYKPIRTRGLLLSKIGGHWQVGAVQDWWLRYYELRERMPKSREYSQDPVAYRAKLAAWYAEEQDLVNGFPNCKVTVRHRNRM